MQFGFTWITSRGRKVINVVTYPEQTDSCFTVIDSQRFKENVQENLLDHPRGIVIEENKIWFLQKHCSHLLIQIFQYVQWTSEKMKRMKSEKKEYQCFICVYFKHETGINIV